MPVRPLRDAALAGLASAMRSTVGPAALAVRGRIVGRRRIGAFAAYAGEVVTDKTPLAGSRVAFPALGGRIASGAYTGRSIGGWGGLLAGGAAAAGGTYATYWARRLIVQRTPIPDLLFAVGEDAAAVVAATVATRGLKS